MRLVEFTTLGTAAALPSAERFTASNVVRDWMGNIVMLDVGEGAQYRLREAGVSLAKVDLIAITHAHGDHINGLPGLLQSMYLSGRTSRLTIVGPRQAIEFARVLIEGGEVGDAFPVQLVEVNGPVELEVGGQGRDRLVIRTFRTCHSIESYGYVLEWRLGPRLTREVAGAEEARRAIEEGIGVEVPRPFRLAYTGDTSPCDDVINGVRGSNVLVHEATFEASMGDEAARYGHSTSVGAARVAREAGVKRLIMTHISTRYEGFEAYRLEREAREVFPSSVLAWDLARFIMRA